MSEWINVDDRLPDNQSLEDECNEYVLVMPIGFPSCKAMYCDGEWYSNYISKIIVPVTHWMLLPEPPK